MDEWPWITTAQAQQLVHLDRSQFGELKKKLEPTAIKGTTRSRRYHAVELVRVWHAISGASGAKPVDDTELNRGRAIDNERKHLQLMRELEQVVEVEEIREPLLAYAMEIKQAGADLARKYGNDAQDILNERIAAGERRIADYFDRSEEERPKAPAGDRGSKPSESPAVHAAVLRG